MLPKELQEYLNTDEGMGRVLGNAQLYKTLLGSFAKNNYYDQLCSQMESGELDAAAQSAHAIKGMAGNLGMSALYLASVNLESGLKAGSPTEDSIERMRVAVEKTMEAVSTAIETL